jgi:hypothetical protein
MAGEPAESVPAANQTLVLLRGVAGAIAGGIAGYFAFNFLAARGLYGLMIPGLLIGMAAGIAARGKSQALGIVCAAAALALMIVAEWHRAPMVKDQSLTYFVTHLHQMNNATVKFVMLALGTAAAYWFGQGR